MIRLFFTESHVMENWFEKLVKRRKDPDASSAEALATELLPFSFEHDSDLISADSFYVVRQCRDSVEGQLKILQTVLGATSVVLYWSELTGKLVPFVVLSSSTALDPAAVSPAAGILGALKNRDEVSLAPYRTNSPAIPYYCSNASAGSFFARVVSSSESGQRQDGNYGVLCIDRPSQLSWSQTDRNLITLAIAQLTNVLLQSRDLLFADVERRSLQLVFNSLQALNSALDLDSVYCAATQALQSIVEADYFAVSLINGEEHQLCYSTGALPDGALHEPFFLEDSLVGQVVKYRRILPESSARPAAAPVINGLKIFDTCQSVLVVPLLHEEDSVTGVLIIASHKRKKISRSCREMISVIASQVAVKIELARSHDQIQRMAITDPLTGIANRRAFQRAFLAMYERARRRPGPFSLIICDIDLFKRINDTYGHPFGDQVIKQIAGLLDDVVRTGDLAARIGGEEFTVLLEDTGLAGAYDVAERLRKKVESAALYFEGKAVPVTISLGVAAFPQDTDSHETLFNYADQALYRAKEEGRNRSVCWSKI